MPSLAVANSQQAWNHTVSGVRVLSKIVPAVTEVRDPQPPHLTGRHPVASLPHDRSPGKRIRPASAATQGSPGSRRQCRTRKGTRRSISGSARPRLVPSCDESSPVKWIPQTQLRRFGSGACLTGRLLNPHAGVGCITSIIDLISHEIRSPARHCAEDPGSAEDLGARGGYRVSLLASAPFWLPRQGPPRAAGGTALAPGLTTTMAHGRAITAP